MEFLLESCRKDEEQKSKFSNAWCWGLFENFESPFFYHFNFPQILKKYLRLGMFENTVFFEFLSSLYFCLV